MKSSVSSKNPEAAAVIHSKTASAAYVNDFARRAFSAAEDELLEGYPTRFVVKTRHFALAFC
jgi:hypothetical protein